jgi:hypothetical protein
MMERLEIFAWDNFYLAPKLYIIAQNKLLYFTLLRLILLDAPQTKKIMSPTPLNTTFKNHFKNIYANDENAYGYLYSYEKDYKMFCFD